VVQIDGVTYGRLMSHGVVRAIRDFLDEQQRPAAADRAAVQCIAACPTAALA
jgi:hypothetical protein